MLAPGGRIVYSTCTFAPAENEGSMTRFLLRHPEFHIVEVKKAEGMSAGVPEWAYFGEKWDRYCLRLHRRSVSGHSI